MHPKFQHLPRQIRERRKERKIRQSQLAELAGVTQSAISMLENGQSDAVSDAKLVKILEVLELKPESDRPRPVFGFCPSAQCPYLRMRFHGGRLLPVPLVLPADLDSAAECACGTLLEVYCPSGCQGFPVGLNSIICPRCDGEWLGLREVREQPDFAFMIPAYERLKEQPFDPEELLEKFEAMDQL
ncbi:MAG: helix-turn-helix transcriptional regulator, partial [Candidatus Omnitrophica bacterium]|nr:helix-turn-helix transcriptional regulator [Candidatus Omnitrophota bacterium]